MSQLEVERLTRIFAALLAPAVLGGCGNKIDESQFSYDMCGNNAGWTMLDAVEPETAVDYLELRRFSELYGDEPPTEFTVVDSSGTLCATASDPSACMAAYESLELSSDIIGGGFDLPDYYMLPYTVGDEVEALRSIEALRAFLGPIDAPGDAAALARLSGRDINCTEAAEVGDHADGFVVYIRSGTGCGKGDDVETHVLLVKTDGTMEIIESELIEKGDPGCVIGRLPPGLCRRRVGSRGASAVGTFLAKVAALEAASVPAFEQLTTELVVHRAPGSLVRAAIAARSDEVRHARVMAQLAREHGGRPRPPALVPTPPRSLVAVAEDNAIEGCVRETFGALVATVQARRAGTPRLRRIFARIARDETRHAALSWSFDRWVGARLSPGERTSLARKRAAGIERLRLELTGSLEPIVHAQLGLPTPDESRQLFDGLTRARDC